MRKKHHLFTIIDISITYTLLAALLSLILWLIFTLIGVFAFQYTLGESISGALIVLFLHWFSDVFHQLGHGFAARRVGYPMREIRLVHVLAVSIYPRNEPDLPAETHIRRALGGAPATFLLALIGAILAFGLRTTGGIVFTVALFFFIDNAIVLGLGAFLPLGFTDGSTLLKWLPLRRKTG
jgi:hypothetical protein